jgi:transposase
MEDHGLCTQCRSTPLATITSMDVKINPSGFIGFMQNCQSSSPLLSPMERSAVVILHQLGISADLVSLLTRRDPRTVNNWIKQFDEDYGIEDRPRTGRPSSTSANESQDIIELAREHPFLVPRDIKHMLDLEVSARTVRRVLDEGGLFARIARHDYPYTSGNFAARIQFAQDKLSWDEQAWSTVVFADEAYIYLGQNGKIYVQRPVNQEFEEKYMAVVGPLNAKIGAWAAFSSHGTLPIELYQGTMNMVRLKAVFKKNLIRPAAAQFSGQPIRLLQDNAKYHIGHAIHQWLFNNGVDEVKIPTYSPDLNPMENMFSILKHNIEARNPKNIETLQEIAKDEWGKISQTLCRELASSMPHRVRCILACDGRRTGY